MRVVSRLSLAWDSLRAEVHQKDHVIELKQCLVEENQTPPEALY